MREGQRESKIIAQGEAKQAWFNVSLVETAVRSPLPEHYVPSTCYICPRFLDKYDLYFKSLHPECVQDTGVLPIHTSKLIYKAHTIYKVVS